MLIKSLAFKNNCDIEYRFERLPTKLRPWYKYAMDFTNVIRKKTPKVIYLSKYLKCLMMEDSPLNSLELTFTEASVLRFHRKATHEVKVITRIGSEHLEIHKKDRFISSKQEVLEINPY